MAWASKKVCGVCVSCVYLADDLTKPLWLQNFVPKLWMLQMDRRSDFSSSYSVGVEEDK